ncbi:hypothetical protein IV203_027367 [Nitzschia inconspicua]|uniref:DUF1664 domain-containing protein n=1 Tax=Nitzschia inconspicua TaxID=303405 RepID=A0A9K3LYU7_9STRA|nr:hypothetical protein IV203_027367 [Nitzschia inconspicua]
MSGAAAAKGPLAFLLRSQTGQWFTITLGAIYAFPEQAKALVFPALKEASQWSDLAKQLSQGVGAVDDKTALKSVTSASAPTPIIIHTGGSSSEKGGYVATIATYAIGAGACWVGFVVLTNALPEAVKEVMPVTRKFFSKTSHVLAEGIIQVKKVMEEKIAALSKKQDTMDAKLDDTHASVLSVQKDLVDTRGDISKLGDSMVRQEETLMSSKRLQSYTSKGVTLLVRCVASMLPTNDRSVNELAQYIKDGEEMGKREQEQRRLSELRGPGSILSPPPEPKTNYMIRESECDSSLHSLEDVNTILGIGPGGLLTAI